MSAFGRIDILRFGSLKLRMAALYAALSEGHPVGHGALVLQGDGLPALLSRSPELFFRTQADGTIVTRPMKGTRPRGMTVTL